MSRSPLLALALGGCTLTLSIPSCSDQTETRAETKAADVQVAKILKQEVTDNHEWFGYLEGKESTDIHPRLSGFLVAQEYANGSKVQAGDVLFRIDSAPFEAALAQAEANLLAAQATLSAAEATKDHAALDVQRFTQLATARAASEKDLSDAQQRLKAAEASVKAAQAAVEQQKAAVHSARINLDYCTIRAPYDGIVGTAVSSIGDLVSPSTKMTDITSVDPIKVKFAINSASLIDAFRKYGNLNSEEQGKLPPPHFELQLEDGSVYPLKGCLTAMGSTVSENGLIDVEGLVDNPDSLLREGMPVRLRIPSSTKEALLVPTEAVRTVMRNHFIIIVDKDKVPHTVPVKPLGEYEVTVNGHPQKLAAIGDYNTPLEEVFKSFGYADPTEAVVVADPVNGVHAQNVSAANSRRPEGAPAATINPVPAESGPSIPAALKALAQQAANGKPQPENPDAKPTMPPIPVKYTPLLKQDVSVQDEWFGTLRGEQETAIRPQVTGFLRKANFAKGTMVKKGDVLYEIDPSTYETALEQAKANLLVARAAKEQALAQLDMNKKDYERYIRLREGNPGAISEKTVTDAKTAIETCTADVRKAEATIAQMEAAVKTAEINLGYTTIRAPFDGRVGLGNPSEGALVSPTDPQPMVVLSSVNPIRVDFNVSGKGALKGISSFGAEVNRGQVPEAPEFEIVLEDGTVYPAKGRVVSTDNALNRSTGTLQVIGQVENVDGGLRSGMPVRVRAGMDKIEGAYLVPARAPLNAQGLDMIVLLRPDNSPVLLPVTKGALVNIPVKGPDGKEVVQPMQIIDINRELAAALILEATHKPGLDYVVLGENKNWAQMALVGGPQAQEAHARALLEERAGAPLPDNAPAKAGVEGWRNLLLKESGMENYREFILKKTGAKDELDLIAQSQGCKDAMEMALKKLGIDGLENARVVAEGSLMAAKAYGDNMKSHSHANKVTPIPFQYTQPKTVVDSVTAEK